MTEKSVMTVTGPVKALGFTHAHEHLSIEKGRSSEINPVLRIDDLSLTVQELYAYKEAGGQSIVDAQPVGCGRNALAQIELSRQSGVNIVASTGFHKQMFYPESHWLFTMTEEELAELFLHELREGMFLDCDNQPPSQSVPNRAGVIKTALDGNSVLSKHERKVFAAAARVSCKGGAPIMVHVEAGSDPVGLADFLEGRGVPVSRVIFCHMDRMIPDLAVHAGLCARGAFMEYDTIARPKYHSDEREAEILRALLNADYARQILLGLDVTRARLKSYGGEVGLCYLLETFLPLLREHGVSDVDTDLMLRHNADRAFASDQT